MSLYNTGTITLTSGSKAVVGVSTMWIGNVRKGDTLFAPNGTSYEIDSVDSNTSITLVQAYVGTTGSGLSYWIVKLRTSYNTGTITLTSGSTAVVGASTTWVGNVRKGDTLFAPNGTSYEIDSVDSNTSITLVQAYVGTTAASLPYWIVTTSSPPAAVSPIQFGATYNDSTDDGPAIERASGYAPWDVKIGDTTVTGGRARVLTTIDSPVDTRFQGGAFKSVLNSGDGSALEILRGAADGSVRRRMMRLNLKPRPDDNLEGNAPDDPGPWVERFPGVRSNVVDGIHFRCVDAKEDRFGGAAVVNTSSGSPAVMVKRGELVAGRYVSGAGIPVGTTVLTGAAANSTATLSQNATATATNVFVGMGTAIVNTTNDSPSVTVTYGTLLTGQRVVAPGISLGTGVTTGAVAGNDATLGLNATATANDVLVGTLGKYVTAIEFAGSQHFKNLFFNRTYGGVRQALSYCDLVTVERWNSFDNLSLSTDTYRQGYMVELPFTGDGVLVRQGISDETTDEFGRICRGKAVYLRFKSGARVSEILNGDVVVEDCHEVELSGFHHENGQVRVINSSGSLHDMVFYRRSATEANDGGAIYPLCRGNITPLIFEQLTESGSNSGTSLRIRNIFFEFGNNPFDRYYVGTAIPDFKLEGNGEPFAGTITLENVSRRANSDNSYSENILFGSVCGEPDFDDYSHIASRHSRFTNGQWLISGMLPPIPGSNVGLLGVSISPQNFRKWRGPVGEYYYKVVALYDRRRMCGVVGTQEKSVCTNGTYGPRLALDPDFCGPWMYRVYRGTSSGNYDKYVDVPLISGGYLHDSFEDIGGYPWLSNSNIGGALHTFNQNIDTGFTIRPGRKLGSSYAYGNVDAYLSSNALPVAGAWNAGDRLWLSIPTVVGQRGAVIGYARRTDCPAGATSNAPTRLGVAGDWMPIYSQIINNTAQIIDTDADVTLTLVNDSPVIMHTGTLTNNRTITLPTTGLSDGDHYEISRTGAGAFNLSIGGLRNLATNTWCKVVYAGGGWKLSQYGSL